MKYFIEYSEYHDNGELVPQLFDNPNDAISYGKANCKCHCFIIWGIGETELEEYDTFIEDYRSDLPERYTGWMNSQEYYEYDLNNSKQRAIEKGRIHIDSWNQHVLQKGYGDKYLITI